MKRRRLSRRLEDGDRLQHAALRRPDLALRRQQLHEGQGSDALRPALLEFADSTRMPAANHILLPAQLLLENNLAHGKMVLAGDARWPTSRSRSTISPPRKITSPRPLSVFGGKLFRRRCHLCHGRFRPHRRRHQSAGQAGNTSSGPARRSRRVFEMGRKAKVTEGSWWPHWQAMDREGRTMNEVPARKSSAGKLKPLDDAPGTYVRETRLKFSPGPLDHASFSRPPV
jgi:hypothetical protein